MFIKIACILFIVIYPGYTASKVTYVFPEFPYKETSKNEVIYREVEGVCERGCLDKNGVAKTICVRQCVSPSCFRDLYQHDMVRFRISGVLYV
ncbi:unnamed protein product [Acanthoscelides obtectus]|uniref:Uncharacterized protein n=1 Tax=Acanthoscelides obtectus TaxID=200917 RepID=A0A9P0KA24_ACAOB|nr:unnamed protein product [Acanthoscelides obtectus]CAK1622716.1 hypothetical protein AOBTE_LOCUS1635 [Acanthoscelides obtectus]